MKALRNAIPLVIAVIAVLGGLRSAHAGTNTLMFEWRRESFTGSCVNPGLVAQGQANFMVNALPIPTFTVLGPYVDSYGAGYANHEAPFNSSLLRVGKSQLRFMAFNANGTPGCNRTHDHVVLSGLTGPRVLWDQTSIGADVDTTLSIDTSLKDIDPYLAEQIEKFKNNINDLIKQLDALGPQADDAARNIARLEALVAALDELLERGFDQITLEELEALLADFSDLLPGLYDDLVAIIQGFKQVIEALRTEINRISNEFHDWTSDITNYGDSAGGFQGSDFEPPPGQPLPEVDVPDVLDDEPWRPDHDIYDAYADQVITALTAKLDASKEHVVDRAGFVAIISAWRQNLNALESALQSKATVNQAEYGAFLASQNKVLGFVSRFMDREGWFHDAAVDPEIKLLIDTALHQRDAPRAERIKAALNVMNKLNNEQASLLFGWVFMLKELGIATEQARVERLRAQVAAKEEGMWSSVLGFLDRAASVGWDLAVTLTPVGDLIDACELITGKEGCHLISGRDLSWGERAFSGIGLFMWGSATAARKLASKVDLIKCRTGAGLRVGVLYIAAPCKFAQFIEKLDEAMDKVQHKTPVKADTDALKTIPHADGSFTYFHKNGMISVTYNQRGFPVFERHHMHPTIAKPEVWVTFTCDSAGEIRLANQAAGITQELPDYTWHHSHEFERQNGVLKIKMQLVADEVHDWALHAGGSALGRAILGKSACR